MVAVPLRRILPYTRSGRDTGVNHRVKRHADTELVVTKILRGLAACAGETTVTVGA
jgi:hypothetical protein